MKLFPLILLFCVGISHPVEAQENEDLKSFEMIFQEALSDNTAYESLRYLSKEIGGRLPNSPEAREAVKFTAELMKSAGADTIFYQEMMVRNWIRGTEYPDEYIIIGGHLDAWDTSEGAHDDGVGCIQSIEVLRIFTELGIKPKHSIRAVMFMDEEVSGTGSVTYAEHVRSSGEKHLLAIECDRGGTSPVGFYIDAPDKTIARIAQWKPLFLPYGIHLFTRGGSGADVGRLKEFNTVLIGYLPDTNRYFDYHHSPNDTFEKVNKREMQMGSAANAALIFLIDKYGLDQDQSKK